MSLLENERDLVDKVWAYVFGKWRLCITTRNEAYNLLVIQTCWMGWVNIVRQASEFPSDPSFFWPLSSGRVGGVVVVGGISEVGQQSITMWGSDSCLYTFQTLFSTHQPSGPRFSQAGKGEWRWWQIKDKTATSKLETWLALSGPI